MKLVLAAPTSGLPLLPTALLAQVSCAIADPTANTDNSKARSNRFMALSPSALRQNDKNLFAVTFAS
jgi:hypothetical protein